MSQFPYETISSFFEDQGDFPENQEDPFGFTQAINWDAVDENLDEIAEILDVEPHVCNEDCDPGNCEVAHHDHFWGEQDNPR